MTSALKSGRPVGTRFPAPQNPDRVRKILDMRGTGSSYQGIAEAVGISRVAVRLLWLRWKDSDWDHKSGALRS